MRQLTFVGPDRLEWWDVPEPRLQEPTDALVRPFIAGRCDGDTLFLRSSLPRLFPVAARLHMLDPYFDEANPFAGPFAYGHECVAEVVVCGPDVHGISVGQVVVVPWALSCGSCHRCHAGLTSHCVTHDTPVAAYGFSAAFGSHGGMVSDLVRVPHASHMLVPVPDDVDPVAVASASDNLSDAYRTVAPHLARQPGAPVLVVGGAARSIGLYAAGIAVALGASRVDYVDDDEQRLGLAEQLGAQPIHRSAHARWYRQGAPALEGGYPITVDASSTAVGLRYALRTLAPGGFCTGVGFYMHAHTKLPLWNMYLKSGTLHVGVAHPRAVLPDVIDLVRRGFCAETIITLRADWKDAPVAFLEPATKVIVTRPRLRTSP